MSISKKCSFFIIHITKTAQREIFLTEKLKISQKLPYFLSN